MLWQIPRALVCVHHLQPRTYTITGKCGRDVAGRNDGDQEPQATPHRGPIWHQLSLFLPRRYPRSPLANPSLDHHHHHHHHHYEKLRRLFKIISSTKQGLKRHHINVPVRHLLFHGVAVKYIYISRFYVLQVPKQPNSDDCGIYLIHFVETFITRSDTLMEVILVRVQLVNLAYL